MSSHPKVDKVLDTKTKYTQKENSVVKTDNQYLRTISRDDVNPVTSRTEVRKKSYTYGKGQSQSNKDVPQL